MSKTAIITGASSGIGRESAIALSKAGWNVVLTARRLDQLNETAQLCPGETLVLAGSIIDEPFVKSVFEATTKRFDRLDLLFNNAGISPRGIPLDELTLEGFKEILDTNLIGAFIAAREAMKVFKSQSPKGGRIINNGSLSAHVPRPNASPYTISKHGMTGLTKSIALEGRAYDITCTQIDIGNAHTTMAAGHTVATLQPDGRMMPEPTMSVEYVASTIVHIASMPPDVAMLEVNIMAAGAPYVGRG
ncbi:hypothetical protein CPB84DRAFT_1959119 [Gymnopilus junonius]|uniref:Short-chain dehydrogenase/reductase SDR n=1 Tax=Gymnopilus junonius TaxID=109634 RepID=A0A9P5TSK3_GYMJU|nr:hypothetical protein CPB84DRAFT_1959119 [Gymnopilus junonius]